MEPNTEVANAGTATDEQKTTKLKDVEVKIKRIIILSFHSYYRSNTKNQDCSK